MVSRFPSLSNSFRGVSENRFEMVEFVHPFSCGKAAGNVANDVHVTTTKFLTLFSNELSLHKGVRVFTKQFVEDHYVTLLVNLSVNRGSWSCYVKVTRSEPRSELW